MSLCPFLGLQVSTFPRGVSEMNPHQTQMLFPTSVACLDGKICDNSQKKVNSPVAMETSYRFFLFLFLLFAVNESVPNPAGRQPGRRPSPAQPRQGTKPAQSQQLSLCTLSPKDFFSGSSLFRKSSSVAQEGWPFIPWCLWLWWENEITQTHSSVSWLTSTWFSSFPSFLHPKQVVSSINRDVPIYREQSLDFHVFQGIIWESWDRPVPCQERF